MNVNSYLRTIKNYSPLVEELIKRDLKLKYRRSVLGYLWSLLNPVIMMVILSFVFSHAFKTDMAYFPLYVISGNVLFSFFNEGTNVAMRSIVDNSALIKKVYIPKFIFPITSVLSSFVMMSFSLVAILGVIVVLKVPFRVEMLLFPIPLLFELLFSMGVGLILSALSVYFRDINHLYSLLTLAWMYATPVFYPVDALPEDVANVIYFNPMFYYIDFFRSVVMHGEVPGLQTWAICAGVGILFFTFGLLVFRKMQRNFILYL